VRARGDHFTRSAVLLADSPPEAEDVVLEVAGPADPADRYVLGALVRWLCPGCSDHSDYLITVLEECPA
jgi:hypothetical protein